MRSALCSRGLALAAALPFLLCHSVRAGEVLKTAGKKVLVGVGSGDDWSVDDSVCFYRGSKKIGCGTVVKMAKAKALVEVGSLKLSKGDRAEGTRASSAKTTSKRKIKEEEPEDRATASAEEAGESYGSASNRRFDKPLKFDLTGGLNASLNLFYPTLTFQLGLSPSIALGLRPAFFRLRSETSTLSAYGAMLTVNYYRDHHFKGLWGQAGIGAYFYSITQGASSESPKTLVGLATIGWRLRFKTGLNIGIAGGVQYIGSPNSTLVAVEFDGIRPIAVLDAGFAF